MTIHFLRNVSVCLQIVAVVTWTWPTCPILDAENVDPSQVGLIITYALSVTQVLNWLVRMTSDVETNIVAVERIKEYSEIINENEWTSLTPPPQDWPSTGSLEFNKYGMRYNTQHYSKYSRNLSYGLL